jgi:hypothetical protein
MRSSPDKKSDEGCDPAAASERPPDRLGEIARIAVEVEAPEIAAGAAVLAERLAERRFYVTCIGQFKRGKSTLLNALVGHPLLPVGVVPITTAVTVLRYGERVRVRVRLGNRWKDIPATELAAYVSEEHNPANEKGVSIVEAFVPSPLLATGMCLVDTPGIGSVIATNTEATRAFVPHIDAALVVLGADPPISGDELDLIASVAGHVSDLIFVLSKADRLTERERREAIAFARKVLAQRLGKLVGPILEISATERLAARDAGRDWDELERALETLAATAGSDLVRQSETRGTALLAERLSREIAEQRDALVRPVEESERRIAALRACVAEAEQALGDLGYLLTAEQDRLSRAFEERWRKFLEDAAPAATGELTQALGQLRGRREEVRRRAIKLTQGIATRWVDRWLADAEPAAERLYGEAARRFARLASEFLKRLAASGEALAGLPRSVSPDLGFRTRSRLYYADLVHRLRRSLLQRLLDALRPPAMARRHIGREMEDYLRALLSTNATRIVNDLEERVLESRRRLEIEIRGCLDSVSSSAERALQRARAQHAAGSDAVRAELDRLDGLYRRVEALRRGEAKSMSLASPAASE